MDANHQATVAAAAHRAALAVPLHDRATLVVTGRDRLTWLNGLLTCDLTKPPPGASGDEPAGHYGLFVARSGRVMADALVVTTADAVLVSVPESTAAALRAHLDHYLVMEDAEIAPATDAYVGWAIHGPRSGEVLAAARAAGAEGAMLDRTGLGGAVVLAPAARAEDVTRALRTALVGVQGAEGDANAWDALRIERGVPEFGADFGDATYPQEAGLEKTAVSFSKGCYLGQEVVCMLEMRGHVKRKLVSLVLDGGAPPAAGAPVLDDTGAPCGEVTSAAQSPTLGAPIAFAMVKRQVAQPGRSVAIGEARGKVVERPA